MSNIQEEFKREALLGSLFEHPNICHTYGVSTVNNKIAVIMDKEKCTLEQLCKDMDTRGKPFTFEEVASLLLDICTGMNYLHTMDIMHRDMNIGNFLISSNFVVKVCDFGKSKQFISFELEQNGNGEHTAEVGASYYRAPECNSYYYSHEGDIWSFAIVAGTILESGRVFEPVVLLPDESHWFEDKDVPMEPGYTLIPNNYELAMRRLKCINAISDNMDRLSPILKECLCWRPVRRMPFCRLVNNLLKLQQECGFQHSVFPK